MYYVTILQGSSVDDAKPVLATSDPELIAELFDVIQRRAASPSKGGPIARINERALAKFAHSYGRRLEELRQAERDADDLQIFRGFIDLIRRHLRLETCHADKVKVGLGRESKGRD